MTLSQLWILLLQEFKQGKLHYTLTPEQANRVYESIEPKLVALKNERLVAVGPNLWG